MDSRRFLQTAGCVLACAMLPLLATCSGKAEAPATAPVRTINMGQNEAEPSLLPKFVLQFGHQAPVVAVAWANGGKNLISLGNDGSIVAWDWNMRAIVNTAHVPNDWKGLKVDKCVVPEAFKFDEAKKTFFVSFEIDRPNRSGFSDEFISRMCPGLKQARGEQFHYVFDTDTWQLKSNTSIPKSGPTAHPQGYISLRPNSGGGPADYPNPAWPLSPDGKWKPEPNHDDGKPGNFDTLDEHLQFNDSTCASITKCRYGVTLFPVNSKGKDAHQVYLTGEPRSYFLEADISPDGSRLVRVEGLKNDTEARAEALDLLDGSAWHPFIPGRAYHNVRWLDAQHYVLTSDGYLASDDTEDAQAGFPPAQVVDADCASRSGNCPTIESHWGLEPLRDSKGKLAGFLGLAPLEGCYRARPGLRFYVFCPDRELGSDELNAYPAPFSQGLSKASFTSSPDAQARWQALEQPALPPGEVVTAVKVSPDNTKLAIATLQYTDSTDGTGGNPHRTEQQVRVLLCPLDKSGMPQDPRQLIEFNETASWNDPTDPGDLVKYFTGPIASLDFTSDGAKLIFMRKMDDNRDRRLFVLNPTQASTAKVSSSFEITGGPPAESVFDLDLSKSGGVRWFTFPTDRVVAAGKDRAFGLDNGELIDLDSGERLVRVSSGGNLRLVNAGYIARSNLVWGAFEDGAIRFWDGGNGSEILTLYTFSGNLYFAVMPGGRYDTNLGPENDLVHWLLPDKPWQSLPAQAFMRDYYEPELYRKLLNCRAETNCDEVLKPLTPIKELNRLLPKVSVTNVQLYNPSGVDGVKRMARVTVDVEDGGTPGGKQSGIYDLRLFMNHRLVAVAPDVPDAVAVSTMPNAASKTPDPDAEKGTRQAKLDEWRATHRLARPGKYVFTFPVPTGTEGRILRFDAYAFNEDRINSDPTQLAMVARKGPFTNPRVPQAYVLNIGIDAYDTQHRLSFSASDARLLWNRLDDIPGYKTHREALVGVESPNGKTSRVDAGTIVAALTRIASEATPDDIIIVSYSGHGWADKFGNFYLVPANGSWPKHWAQPDLRTLVSSTQLSNILRQSHAREIALIIDACQSAGSFNGGGFKPGPMGDPGLGQLAYDKGILILAASQADALAHESGSLKQGLLTYALTSRNNVVTGLDSSADLNHDGQIHLDEWLRYAARKLPSIAESLYDPKTGKYRGFARGNGKDVLQKPSLFDFTKVPSPVVLPSDVIQEVPYTIVGTPLSQKRPPKAPSH